MCTYDNVLKHHERWTRKLNTQSVTGNNDKLLHVTYISISNALCSYRYASVSTVLTIGGEPARVLG